MKFYHKKLFFSLLFIIFFFYSNQNEQKKLERIENATKFLIHSINDKLTNTSFFLLEFSKYNLFLDNLKILKIFENNFKIIQEQNSKNNEIYYILKNVKLYFISDLNILLYYNTIKEKPFFIECNFIEIKFKLIDDFNIEFISSEIDYINFSKSKKISELDYFSEFNNKINNSLGQGIDLYSNLKNTIKKIFEQKIKEIEQTQNLLTYDMLYLFNNCSEIIDISPLSLLSDSLQIIKIINKDGFINLNKTENSIIINKLILMGRFFIASNDFYFNITCDKEFNHIIFQNNKQNADKYVEMNIQIGVKDCSYDEENNLYNEDGDGILESIKLIFIEILNQNAKYYYNNILEL